DYYCLSCDRNLSGDFF
nr:immunoglobulin light chain junction region [Macaca mulatta]